MKLLQPPSDDNATKKTEILGVISEELKYDAVLGKYESLRAPLGDK